MVFRNRKDTQVIKYISFITGAFNMATNKKNYKKNSNYSDFKLYPQPGQNFASGSGIFSPHTGQKLTA